MTNNNIHAMRKKVFALLAVVIWLIPAHRTAAGQESGWVSLFDGETLEGWTVHSGFAKYRVEDGAIVGTAVKGSPNSFLCTDREFGDFILEFEVLLEDPELNSGVQFRSQIAANELAFWFRNEDGKYSSNTIPVWLPGGDRHGNNGKFGGRVRRGPPCDAALVAREGLKGEPGIQKWPVECLPHRVQG
jgi:hypothetical protein